jgi:hypothetical protein
MAKTAFVTGGTVQDNYDWLVKEGLLAKSG